MCNVIRIRSQQDVVIYTIIYIEQRVAEKNIHCVACWI